MARPPPPVPLALLALLLPPLLSALAAAAAPPPREMTLTSVHDPQQAVAARISARLPLPSPLELDAIRKVAQILAMLGQQVIPAIIGESPSGGEGVGALVVPPQPPQPPVPQVGELSDRDPVDDDLFK